MTKLALGTVQFGLDYGINNPRGKVPEDEVSSILDQAAIEGIDTLDTSSGYGESEKVLGRVLNRKKCDFKIISKFPRSPSKTVSEVFHGTLNDLGSRKVYGYLLHHFDVVRENPEIWEEFTELKKKELVRKIGFSLYHPEELRFILDRKFDFDLVQVPFNIFDRRFQEFFPLLAKMGIEIHVRSVFLQGLLLKNMDEIPAFFEPIKEKISRFHSIAKSNGLKPAALALDFAFCFNAIDRVVIGVDSLDNLKENHYNLTYIDQVRGILTQLESLIENREDMILPTNWKK